VTDLPDLLAQVRTAVGPHDPVKAAGGRCRCLPCRTSRLAARGWPNTTTGDGSGIRSTATGSSTERAALTPDEYTRLNERASRHLDQLRAELVAILSIAHIVDSHGTDDDIVPPGTGECACGCGKTCDPRRRGPEDRLKAGLHPSCHRRWLRWRSTYPGVRMSDFIDACYRERGETRAQPVAEPRAS
jgi:hypothetical protein